MVSLKLVSVNIERSKHLDTVASFLRKEAPDVVCVQELMEYDIPLFEKMLDAACIMSAVTRRGADERHAAMYTGIFSRHRILSHAEKLYRGDGVLRDFDMASVATKYASENIAFLYADIEKDGATFRIGTTHFTWTPDGKPDDYQRADLQKFLSVVKDAGEVVFCGDFNAPRGGEIFAEIAKRYKDNIPMEYAWSLDTDIHRAGLAQLSKNAAIAGLEGFMVDGLFTTLEYVASDVRLVSGVSDHCAIVAMIAKAA